MVRKYKAELLSSWLDAKQTRKLKERQEGIKICCVKRTPAENVTEYKRFP